MVKTLSGAKPLAKPARAGVSAFSVNWTLFFGLALVGLVVILTVAGPDLAPRDPLKDNFVMRVGGKFLRAPFAPFVVPGFPLGSDERGRDIVSLLLWAVRPTMILVAIVATIRLVLGLSIGLVSGWSTGFFGRSLDTLITAALTAPVLIVALAVVAVLGVEAGRGLTAFIVGLSLTGWAETARVVREQTRGVRGQAFVEAARALGASDQYLLWRHALPHVMPLVWVLLAFEISGTILTIAGLGFLGYYTSDVWIMISDTMAQRFAGLPDLGQMLSTVSSDIFTGPYKMFAAGSVVFITVLGFNLLGAGLRQQLNVERVKRRTWLTVARERLQDWYQGRLEPVLERPTGRRLVRVAGALVLLLLAGLGVVRWRLQAARSTAAASAALAVPGGHLWATERHDPYGTKWVAVDGPAGSRSVAWTFQDSAFDRAGGYSGGPIVAADGTVYVAGQSLLLTALDPLGKTIWQLELPAEPVGTPALGRDGEIYVADQLGGLSAVSPHGSLLWYMSPTGPGEGTGGPIVAPDGSIYFTIGGDIQAVSPDGRPRWRAVGFTRRIAIPPVLDPAAEHVSLRNAVLASVDGQKLKLNSPRQPDQYLVGADGRTYLRLESLISRWTLQGDALQIAQELTWDPSGYAWGMPTDAGVTPGGRFWLAYTPDFEDGRYVLVEPDGVVDAFYRFPLRPARVIGLDRQDVAYICGRTAAPGLECGAYPAKGDQPLWVVSAPGATAAGGALVPGRLYVTTAEGMLSAIGTP